MIILMVLGLPFDLDENNTTAAVAADDDDNDDEDGVCDVDFC